jgi:hypothetical protein
MGTRELELGLCKTSKSLAIQTFLISACNKTLFDAHYSGRPARVGNGPFSAPELDPCL